jgi:peptide chain release factor 1
MKFSLDNIITEYESLETELTDPSIYSDLKRLKAVNQKKKSMEKTVELYREYKQLYANYEEIKGLVSNEKDPEMLEMMKSEIATADIRIPELEEEIKIALPSKRSKWWKKYYARSQGGGRWDEAGLFAHELAEGIQDICTKRMIYSWGYEWGMEWCWRI